MKALRSLRPATQAVLLIVTTVGLLFARRPDQFLHPYIWVEDGLYILTEFVHVGFWTLTRPLAGYFLLVTKLMSVIAYRASILWAPEIELVLIVGFTCGVIAAIAFSPTHLRWPWLCALGTLLIPTDAETFAVSAYAFWWSGPLLILALLWDSRRGLIWLRCLYVILGGLSSPIIGPVAVLLWIRAGLERRTVEILTAALATLAAAVQVVGMRQQGLKVHVDAITARVPLDLIERFVGDYFYPHGPRLLALAIFFGLAGVVWFSRRRLDRYFLLLVLAYGAISVVVPLRLPAGQFENLDPFVAGPRYFLYPFICLTWILIWLAHESSPRVRIAIAAAWVVALVVAAPGLSRRHEAIDWKTHILACAASDRYEIPIHYNGYMKDVLFVSYTGEQCRKLLDGSVWRSARRPVALPHVVAARGTTIGVFRGGQWLVDLNANRVWDGERIDGVFTFGDVGDVPVVGDWGGVDKVGIGVFRAGQWLLDLNANRAWDGPTGGDLQIGFGQAGDIPVVGQWDGGATTRIGVFRDGVWMLDVNGNGVWDGPAHGDKQLLFGQAGDLPVVGDWSGSGKTNVGVYRKGQWLLDANGNGMWDGPAGGDQVFTFGEPGDVPVVGRWDQSSKSRIGTFRNGQWFLDTNGSGGWDGIAGGDRLIRFGVSGDAPVAGRF